MSRPIQLKKLLAEVANDSSLDPSDHPPIESLTTYHDGLLPERDAQKLLDHVQVCRDCTSLLLDLNRLGPASLDEADEVSPLELERGWVALKAQLPTYSAQSPEGEPREGAVIPFPSAEPAARSHRTPPWYHALAAGLLLAVVGQTVRLQGLQREIDRLDEPQINTPYVVLSDARTRGAADSAAFRSLPGSAEGAHLLITPNALQGPQTKTYESFRAEITSPKRRWSKAGLVLGKQREFSILVQKRFFGSGEARVRIFGSSAGQEDMLAEFQLRLDSE